MAAFKTSRITLAFLLILLFCSHITEAWELISCNADWPSESTQKSPYEDCYAAGEVALYPNRLSFESIEVNIASSDPLDNTTIERSAPPLDTDDSTQGNSTCGIDQVTTKRGVNWPTKCTESNCCMVIYACYKFFWELNT